MLLARTKVGINMDNKLLEILRGLSKQTKIPVSRLVDEAVEDLVTKYQKKRASEDQLLVG